MPSKQVVQILIEAEENVSKVAKKAEDALNKMGNAGSKGMSKITNIASKVQSGFSKLHSYVDRAREKFNEFRNSSDKLGMLKNTISNAAGSFGQLINNSNRAASAMEKLKSVSDTIQTKFTSLKSKITGFGSSVKSSLTGAFNVNSIKSKLTSLGGSVDKLKAKFRSLKSELQKTGGSGGLGFLRNAASMTVGMLGYDLVASIMETTRASLNARSSVQAFATRLNMNANEVTEYQKSLDSLQSSFKKIDMDVVGQQATDMAYRLGLPKQSLTELTETTAIFTDAMQRNGRSAEDSMLAMSDAMDGQFVRLKEIGITQDDLMKNGWSGDINDKTGLLKAMNKALKEQHYDDLAKSVDTLDDAWKVLSVTMGNLLEAVLLPLTPVIVGVINGLVGAVDGIKGFISTLQNAFNGLPDWAKYAVGITAIALAVGFGIAAFGGLQAVLVALIGPLYSVATAMLTIEWPIVAVVAAIALVVAAIYELGKAFGWWTDVSSMLDAIWSGLQRLWNAFINHPDVQAAISGIMTAFQWLSNGIQWAIGAIMQFFGVSTGSKWDIVSSIITGIGIVWEGFRSQIVLVIGVIQFLIGVFTGLWNGINQVGSYMMDVFSPVWTGLVEIFTIVYGAISNLVAAFQAFQNGQISLPTLLMMVWNTIGTVFTTVTSSIVTMIWNFADRLLGGALTAGRNVLTGVVTYLRQLPGRAYTYLLNVWTRLNTAGARWVNTAKQKASQLVLGVITYLMQLPGRVYNALMSVVSRITSAIGHWVSSARSKVQSVISAITGPFSGVANAISSALSGVVSAITGPFQSAWESVKPIVDNIKNAMSIIPGGAWGGEESNGRESLVIGANNKSNKTTTSSNSSNEDNTTIDVNVNEELVLDLKNVPAHIDTDTLIQMLSDTKVLKALTGNKDFQKLDQQMKDAIVGKANRARGV